ncbi:MAG TPA: two-component regulator propeller domain-containing protein [Pirellulales bacterium]|nr:two-component regulator propeller domain-containing protein [Pirellulales bacterium]
MYIRASGPLRSDRVGARQGRALCVAVVMSLLTSLVFGVLLTAKAEALDPNRTLTQALLRKWQVQQGLPQATILSILQTSDHYLWLGTPSGLFRFDGVRFLTMRDVGGISLENLWVQHLCEDARGNLWIATDGEGLIRLAETTATRFRRAEGLPSDNVRRLLADPKGDVWAATEEGLVRFAE